MRRAADVSFVLVILATGCTGGGGHERSAGPGSGSAAAHARLLSATEVGPEPSTLVLAAGSLWVADDLGVERVDPDTGKVLAGLSVGAVGDMAAGDEGIWIIGYGSNAVGEVDPSSNTVTTTIALDRPTGIAVGEGAVWVASRPKGTVTRIDPGTGEVTATIVVNEAPPRFFPFAAGPTGIASATAPCGWPTSKPDVGARRSRNKCGRRSDPGRGRADVGRRRRRRRVGDRPEGDGRRSDRPRDERRGRDGIPRSGAGRAHGDGWRGVGRRVRRHARSDRSRDEQDRRTIERHRPPLRRPAGRAGCLRGGSRPPVR